MDGLQGWHWMLIGIFLMLTELLVPALVAFWFGLGAIVLGVIVWCLPTLGLAWQLFLWLCFSGVMLGIWFLYFRRFGTDRTKAGLSRKAVLGSVGQVISVTAGGQAGQVRFSTPLLGASEWPFLSEDSPAPGDRVWVVEVSGNTLVVSCKNPFKSEGSHVPSFPGDSARSD